MTDAPLASAARDWAAAELDIEPTSGPNEIRQAVWKRLAETNFALHGRHVEAADLLFRADALSDFPGSNPAFRHDYEGPLRDETEAFEGQFFDLHPAERQERWSALASRAAVCPRLSWQLNRLLLGLTIDLQRLGIRYERANTVATWCGELFLLAPPLRAARKLELLSEMSQRSGSWISSAAAQLSKRAPEIAALAPDVIDEMVRRNQLIRRRAKGKKSLTRIRTTKNKVDSGVYGPIVIVGIVLAALRGNFGTNQESNPFPRPQQFGVSDNFIPSREAFPNLQPFGASDDRPVLTIDAGELIDSPDPMARVLELAREHRLEIRASKDDITRLKSKLGTIESKLLFGTGQGDGMVRIDYLGDPQSTDTDTDTDQSLEQAGQRLEQFLSRHQQPSNAVIIDADELLQGPQPPIQHLILLYISQRSQNRDPSGKPSKQRVQVLANTEQLRRLKDQLTETQFRVWFGSGSGEGLADLVETDAAGAPMPDSPAQGSPSPDE